CGQRAASDHSHKFPEPFQNPTVFVSIIIPSRALASMALQFGRLRRAVTSLSSVHRSLSSPIIPAAPIQTGPRLFPRTSAVSAPPNSSLSHSRGFTGSRVSLAQERKYKLYKEGDEMTEDTVLFEGCDFNHWLITVDFPKDPVPSAEEMVATYERICAQGLGISIEEAKKKMYACSTTTYQGFQAIMTEEESEKFKDLPGVVFVLPDSYIDPANKEYGGDKYENGVITHRPPPVQFQRNDRSRMRRRNYRYNQQGPPQYNQQQGNPQYQQQGHPPQNFPPQQNYPPQQANPQFHQQQGPPVQAGQMPVNTRDSQGQQGNYYPPPGQGGFQGGAQTNYGSPGQREFRGDSGNYSSVPSGNYGQGGAGGGRGYPGEAQGFSQRNSQEGQRDFNNPMDQSGTHQVSLVCPFYSASLHPFDLQYIRINVYCS
ncbi:unnamed protein product, partial [Linum tenue]